MRASRATGGPPGRRIRATGWVSPLGVAILVLLGVASGSAAGIDSHARPGRRPPPARVVGPAGPAPVPLSSQYLASGAGYVDFLQLTDVDGSLSGTFRSVVVTGSASSAAMASETAPAVGSVRGSALTVTFGRLAPVTAVVSAGHFTLAVPQPDGTLLAVAFRPVSPAQMQAALANLDRALGQADQQLSGRQQGLSQAAMTVVTDLAGLEELQSLVSGQASALDLGLQTENGDVATTLSTAARVGRIPGASGAGIPGSSGAVCGSVPTVVADAQVVAADAADIGSTARLVLNDVVQVRSALEVLGTDLSHLQAAEATSTGFVPMGTPSPSQVRAAEDAAVATDSAALAASNAALSKAKGGVGEAYGVLARLEASGGCGSSPRP